jgi:hypothetical protein
VIIIVASFYFRSRAHESRGVASSQTTVAASGDQIVYAQAPHCYQPGNPIYYPPEGEREPHGR